MPGMPTLRRNDPLYAFFYMQLRFSRKTGGDFDSLPPYSEKGRHRDARIAQELTAFAQPYYYALDGSE